MWKLKTSYVKSVSQSAARSIHAVIMGDWLNVFTFNLLIGLLLPIPHIHEIEQGLPSREPARELLQTSRHRCRRGIHPSILHAGSA